MQETLKNISKLVVLPGGLESIENNYRAWKKQEQYNPELKDHEEFKQLYGAMELSFLMKKELHVFIKKWVNTP